MISKPTLPHIRELSFREISCVTYYKLSYFNAINVRLGTFPIGHEIFQRCIRDFDMTLPGCISAYVHNLCKSCSGRSGRVAGNFHGRVDRYPMKLVHVLPLYFHPHPVRKLHVTVITSISNKLNISFGHFPP